MSPKAFSHTAVPNNELTLHVQDTTMGIWEKDAPNVNRLIGLDTRRYLERSHGFTDTSQTILTVDAHH
jgi:hypothetical protein